MRKRKWLWGLLIGVAIAIILDLLFAFSVTTRCIEQLSCGDKLQSFFAGLTFFIPAGAVVGAFFGLIFEKKFYLALTILIAGGIGLYLVFMRAPTISEISQQVQDSTSIAKDETPNWKPYIESNFHFTLKYPSTLKVSCPAYPSCFLGSLQLNDQYYSADDVPMGAVVINLGSYGVESDTVVNDPYQWRKSWANGLNASATYKEKTVNSLKTLEERTSKDVTVYISTGTGRVLAFTLFPLNSSNEKLFNSILGTVTVTE